MTDVLAIMLLATISGADDYPGIVEFALDRADLLRGLLALPHLVPSVSTFRRLLAAVDPTAIGEVLGRWSQVLSKTCRGNQIALDGPFDAVQGEPNEIVAVPRVLSLLDLREAIVTVDALNTQKPIAGQTVDAGGCYVITLKENDPLMFDRVVRNVDNLILERFKGVDHTPTDDTDGDHGRIDRRKFWATDQTE